MLKKLWVLFIALVMLGGALCASAESLYPIDTAGKEVTLTVFRSMDPSLIDYISDWNETPFCQAIVKATGIHVEFISPTNANAAEALNLMVASGKLPDIVIGANLYSNGMYQGVIDGVYTDLAPYLEKYAPDYWSIITSDEAIYRDAVHSDGIVDGFYRIYTDYNPTWMRLILKKELMDKLGAEQVPVTIEEWEVLFAKMLAAGITPFALEGHGYDEKFMGAYDCRADFFVDLEGNVQYGQITDNFKQYLTLMHDWYEKGYISKDFVSMSNQSTLFSLDQIGTYNAAIVAAYNLGQTQNYTVLSSPYPRQYKDQPLHWNHYKVGLLSTNYSHGMVSICSTCPNVEVAVQWLNYLYTQEGRTLANWGIEGLNYETVDGKPSYLQTQIDYKGIVREGLNYYFKGLNTATYALPDSICHANLLFSPNALALRLQYDNDPLVDSKLVLPPTVSLNEEDSDIKTRIMTGVDTYVDEMVLKFITGAEPLTNWDSFVATVQGMDIGTATTIMQKAYDSYMSTSIEK